MDYQVAAPNEGLHALGFFAPLLLRDGWVSGTLVGIPAMFLLAWLIGAGITAWYICREMLARLLD